MVTGTDATPSYPVPISRCYALVARLLEEKFQPLQMTQRKSQQQVARALAQLSQQREAHSATKSKLKAQIRDLESSSR